MISKREEIITLLKKSAEESPLVLTFSSPSIRAARFFYIKETDHMPASPTIADPSAITAGSNIEEQDEIQAFISQEIEKADENFSVVDSQAPFEAESSEYFDDPQFLDALPEAYEQTASSQNAYNDYEEFDSSPEKEFSYKEEKRRLKEMKKEEKAFEKIRKDAHKRGFDTGLLYQLDNPEDLYSFSDEEIEQIQAAGIVNDDGFYSFVYPSDIDSFKKEKISKNRLLLIGGLVLVAFFFLAMLIRNIFGLF